MNKDQIDSQRKLEIIKNMKLDKKMKIYQKMIE